MRLDVSPKPQPITRGKVHTHHDNLVITHLPLASILGQLDLGSPIGARLVPMVVIVGHIAIDHELRLVVAVGVDLDWGVLAAGDVGPNCAAKREDFRYGGLFLGFGSR